MKTSITSIITASATLLLGMSAAPVLAAVTILHSFSGASDGGIIVDGSLTLSGSSLYGMTAGAGMGSAAAWRCIR